MILAIDVHYAGNNGIVAGVAFNTWKDQIASDIFVTRIKNIADYQPGEFYKRELPGILKLLDEYSLVPDTIVIDGYVYLDGYSKPGLGKHLYDALSGTTIVIGVAKNPYQGVDEAFRLFRGESHTPLYVTCAGESLSAAKQHIAAMAGKHRTPLLLKLADQSCRKGAE